MGKKSRRQRQNKSKADVGMSLESFKDIVVLPGMPDYHLDENLIASMPQTDAIWCAICTTILPVVVGPGMEEEEPQPRRYYVIAHVEKENGSNGLPWMFRGSKSEGVCDGLSSCLMWFYRDLGDNSPPETLETFFEDILKLIAKACSKPVNIETTNLPIGRPRKILLRSRGDVRRLKPKLRRMGIADVDVADINLVSSIMAGLSTPLYKDRFIYEAVLNECQHCGFDCDKIPLERKFLEQKIKNLKGRRLVYQSEDRVPLGSWRPEFSGDQYGIPYSWFARPPTPSEFERGYHCKMLWGWRSNLEEAVQRNDKEKISDIAWRYPKHLVKEFVEMRLLLTTATSYGLFRSCESLIEPHPNGCGASVDGVFSQDNKPEWRSMQKLLGKDHIPLNCAAVNGDESIVSLLLEKGANPNLLDAPNGKAPLHYAVAYAHIECVKLLLKGGPGGQGDMHLVDKKGYSPLEDANYYFKSTGQRRYKSILTLLEAVNEGLLCGDDILGQCCSACGKPGPKLECPCGIAIYCRSECQKNHWKTHKLEHRKLVAKK